MGPRRARIGRARAALPHRAALSRATLARIDGDTKGLKASDRGALERLLRRRVPPDQSATLDLVRELSALSRAIERRVGVLIDRGGSVERVVLGSASALDLPRLDAARRGAGRLRGLRLVATHVRPTDEPSERDQEALVRARLDMALFVHVNDAGEPEALREAWLEPSASGRGVHLEPRRPPHLLREDLRTFTEELEAAFEAATPSTRDTEGGTGQPALLAVVLIAPRRPASGLATGASRSGASGRHPPSAPARSVGVGDGRPPTMEEELAELRELCRAADLDVRGEVTQRREQAAPATLIGGGRVDDLCARALTTGAKVVVVNEELAPRQQAALEDRLGLRVLDRTQLILDLFAKRARTHQGKLQVEAARLRYQLPRLVGRGGELSRVGGGKGGGGGGGRTKGAGEKKLELERRTIKDRIGALERELANLGKQRAQRRARRHKNRLPHVAIVGYTNAGKSTLFNRLTDANVLAEDRVFATLDPTLRHRRLPTGRRVVISDTVGFIRRLPKDLVRAFGATLDELDDASVLVHVADASDPSLHERVGTVRRILKELGKDGAPELLVLNKVDAVPDVGLFAPLARQLAPDAVMISARDGPLEELLERIEQMLAHEREGDDPTDLLVSEDLISDDEHAPYDPAPPRSEAASEHAADGDGADGDGAADDGAEEAEPADETEETDAR